MITKQEYKNISLNHLFSDNFEIPFQKNKLHEICSYIAMYPAKLVHKLINKYTNKGDTIYDPFSGQGTTLIETRLLKRKADASDLNPLSFVLTKAKSHTLDKNQIIKTITKYEQMYHAYKTRINKKDFNYMKTYFSKNVYKQICFLKEILGKKWNVLDNTNTFILACLLGILHGPTRKDGTSSYLSINMSNTNSMAKNYVDNYVKQHNLHFPRNENVFEKLRKKVERSFSNIDHFDHKDLLVGEVKNGDALNCNKIFKNKKFDCIITSPPYLNIFNYTSENWIRMWLLGYEKDNLKKEIKLDDHHGLVDYKKFLINFMNCAFNVLKENGKLIMIIGNVEKKYNFFKDIWQEIKDRTKFKLIERCLDYRANNKSTRKNGTKSGKATKVDNICVFGK